MGYNTYPVLRVAGLRPVGGARVARRALLEVSKLFINLGISPREKVGFLLRLCVRGTDLRCMVEKERRCWKYNIFRDGYNIYAYAIEPFFTNRAIRWQNCRDSPFTKIVVTLVCFVHYRYPSYLSTTSYCYYRSPHSALRRAKIPTFWSLVHDLNHRLLGSFLHMRICRSRSLTKTVCIFVVTKEPEEGVEGRAVGSAFTLDYFVGFGVVDYFYEGEGHFRAEGLG